MNNHPGHSSIAALLYPQGADVRPTEDTEGHELMEYFQHDYHHAEGDAARADSGSNLVPLPSNAIPTHDKSHADSEPKRSSGRGGPPQQHIELSKYLESTATATPPAPRSVTPPNPAIPIPPTLARIASQAAASIEIPQSALAGQDAIEEAALFTDYGDKGEMGGKRRKQPHERAGWKEMDEQPPGKKRRSKKGENNNNNNNHNNANVDAIIGAAAEIAYTAHGASPAPALEGHGDQPPPPQDMGSLSELSRMALQGPHGQVDPQIDPTLASADEKDAGKGEDSKLSRAEQNKRAQQAYRRRREEHMKKLELDSARLDLVKRQLAEKDAALREVVLALSSSKIEVAALQTSLKTFIPHLPLSILTKEGHLVVDESVQDRDTRKPTQEAVDNAFQLLSAQSRELAKQTLK